MLQVQNLATFLAYANSAPGYAFDPYGRLVLAAANQPRIAYDRNTGRRQGIMVELSTQNRISNPRGVGAVAAVGGGNGTLPTGWSITSTGNYAGISKVQCLGRGTEDGIPFTRLRFSGYTAFGDRIRLAYVALNAVAASLGQVWSASAFMRVLGPATGLQGVRQAIPAAKGASRVLGNTDASANPMQRGGKLKNGRIWSTASMSVDVDYVGYEALFYYGVGAFDFIVDIGVPQLENRPGATTPTFPETDIISSKVRNADAADFPLSAIDWRDGPFSVLVSGYRREGPFVDTPCGILRLAQAADASRIVRMDWADDAGALHLYHSGVGATVREFNVATGIPYGGRFAVGFSCGPINGGRLFCNGALMGNNTRMTPPPGMDICRIGSMMSDNTRPANAPIDDLRLIQGEMTPEYMIAATAAMAA